MEDDDSDVMIGEDEDDRPDVVTAYVSPDMGGGDNLSNQSSNDN